MKTAVKKGLAVLLAFIMVFGAAPAGVLAGIELPTLSFSMPSWVKNVGNGIKALITMPSVEASAASQSDLTFKLIKSNTEYEVSDCEENASGDLVIPTTYNGKPVTSIGESAFSFCSNLTNITIPNSVTTIGSNAFWETDIASFYVSPTNMYYISMLSRSAKLH